MIDCIGRTMLGGNGFMVILFVCEQWSIVHYKYNEWTSEYNEINTFLSMSGSWDS